MNDFSPLSQEDYELPFDDGMAYSGGYEAEPKIEDQQTSTRQERAEDVRLVWSHWARENFDRREGVFIERTQVTDVIARERSKNILLGMARLRNIIVQYKSFQLEANRIDGSKPPHANSIPATMIDLVRNGLSSSLYGTRLSTEMHNSEIDVKDLTDDAIQQFIKIKLGLVFSALAERIRHNGLKEAKISSNQKFYPDIAFLINARMPVAGESPNQFTDLVFQALRSKPQALIISGAWGKIVCRDGGLYMEIVKGMPKHSPHSTSTLKIKVY